MNQSQNNLIHSEPSGYSYNAGEKAPERDLEVNVLFTTTKGTLSALRMAGKLADDLGARIRVIVPQVVPYPLELSHPPVKPEFTARRVCTMVSQHAIETEIQVCLCRDKFDAPLAVLKPNSIVVVGGRKRLWRTEETRMADSIRRQGHQVVFIDQDSVALTPSHPASEACDKVAAS
jgi:hypothetical protein